MTNPAHLLSVAALLLVGFLIGASLGTLARLLAIRLTRKPATPAAAIQRIVARKPVEVPAVPAASAAATVSVPPTTAPVTAELPSAPVALPSPEPTIPDFTATLLALAAEPPPKAFVDATRQRVEAMRKPEPELRAVPPSVAEPASPVLAGMQPARAAGETTSGRAVPAPSHENPPEPPVAAAVGQRSAEVIPFPTVALESATGKPTDALIEVVAPAEATVPASVLVQAAGATPAPADPVAVEAVIQSASADLSPPDEDAVVAEGVGDQPAIAMTSANVLPAPAFEQVTETPAIVIEVPPAVVEASAAVEAPVAEIALPATAPATPAPDPSSEDIAPVASPAVEPVTVSPDDPMDEDAAMRAIEGNWTPRRPAPRPVRPAAPAEGANEAVAAAARAVASARRTAEAVAAEAAAEAGRPAGIDAARDGRKDDLTHIIGVLPVIETALNRLGLYHFDQMAGLSDENIRWIETHLGVPGRISREMWREQARELSAIVKPKRAAEH